MKTTLVIIPSRERPEAARDLAETIGLTTYGEIDLVFVVDKDDPTADQYDELVETWFVPPNGMNAALNRVAVNEAPNYEIIGFMGDDHRPRRLFWDVAISDALQTTGIAYGNDLLQGENLPTAVFMTSDIIQTLGYMAPPTLEHMYLDNFWKVLGETCGVLHYLPHVIIEHLHPFAGKAEMDEGYARVNARAVYERDQQAFEEYLKTRFADDVEKVKALL